MRYKNADADLPTLKRYWSISQTAKLFGIDPSVLRFWETKESKLNLRLHHKRKGSGMRDRLYNANNLIVIYYLHYFLYTDMYTLLGARRQLEMRGILNEFYHYEL